MKKDIKSIIEVLSTSWSVNEGTSENEIYYFQQDFPPDGIDVIVSIRRIENSYEVWSSAEHRVSGPNDTLVGTTQALAEALEIAATKCRDWEEFFRDSKR
jgi:hypothetical protein